MQPKTLLQYFEWYLPADAGHWKRAAAHAAHLRQAGFTGVWLPPAYKGAAGRNDVGYGVYDLYDLGEFDQKGSVPTKYGTKEEYLAAVRALQGQGLAVLADVVLNHRMGADACEQVDAEACDPGDRRRETGPEAPISAWTKFTAGASIRPFSGTTRTSTGWIGTTAPEKRACFSLKAKAGTARWTAKTATTIT